MRARSFPSLRFPLLFTPGSRRGRALGICQLDDLVVQIVETLQLLRVQRILPIGLGCLFFGLHVQEKASETPWPFMARLHLLHTRKLPQQMRAADSVLRPPEIPVRVPAVMDRYPPEILEDPVVVYAFCPALLADSLVGELRRRGTVDPHQLATASHSGLVELETSHSTIFH